MSRLSREIAAWIQTNPGAIYGDDEAQLMDTVRATFILARRWKQPVDMSTFLTHLRSLGHIPSDRYNHATGKRTACLHLPERHIGT